MSFRQMDLAGKENNISFPRCCGKKRLESFFSVVFKKKGYDFQNRNLEVTLGGNFSQ